MRGDLATLDAVKAWLSVKTSDSDALLQRLTSAASRAILNYLQRPSLLSLPYAETYEGYGTPLLLLRQWPVTEVQSVTFAGQAMDGWRYDAWDGFGAGLPAALVLDSGSWPRGPIQVAYTAGYLRQDEAHTIPSGDDSQPLLTVDEAWSADGGVTYAGGVALVLVSGDPGAGEYALGPSPGEYRFAAADAGEAVLITYSFVPADLVQACVEMVGERFRYMDRIGNVSKSLGGQETVSFSTASMHDYVRELLQPYRKVVTP